MWRVCACVRIYNSGARISCTARTRRTPAYQGARIEVSRCVLRESQNHSWQGDCGWCLGGNSRHRGDFHSGRYCLESAASLLIENERGDRTVGEIRQQPAARRHPPDSNAGPRWFAERHRNFNCGARTKKQDCFDASSDRARCGFRSAPSVEPFAVCEGAGSCSVGRFESIKEAEKIADEAVRLRQRHRTHRGRR